MQRKEERKSKKFKRLPIKQHREFLLDPQYSHKVQASKKARLYKQQEDESKQEIREYLNGKDSL